MRSTRLVRPSRDGDQFHYLWAARRCLRLLSAQDDLVAISIEGPSPTEDAARRTAGEEVIDIAEYHASEQIGEARLVRYMQLKHSTLRATEPWTASGLEKTVRGFSARYREFLKGFSAAVLESKLQFSFVTNRPVEGEFVETVADVAAGLPPRHPKELQKLEGFTGLEGGALAAFSKLLHFEGRQDDYWDQRNILSHDVSGYLPEVDVDAPTRLKELVTRKALSEGEANPTITRMDVLRALNSDEDVLFPAPAFVKAPDTAVQRDQEPALIATIVASVTPVLLHASAGVGKTVFATRIAQNLPTGSICVLYDCFGNGQYRNASGYRHRHKDALVQIANELAAKGLCHPLIPTPHADAKAYVRAFLHRIGQAANMLRRTDTRALLCIVVDAADNAQMAAQEIGESRSFVRDLIREPMPDNVRLVFLSRSHRQDYLDPPVGVKRLELKPFSRDETAAHLRQHFPDANDHDVDEFHRLSSQNPRVQALALSRKAALPDMLRALGPNPTTVDDTIGSLLDSAIAKLKDNVGPVERDQVDMICEGLAALRPLIPISILSHISGVPEGAIESFAADLGRPLVVVGGTIQFFDEPAETWFRDRFKPAAQAMQEFIARLSPLAATSAYAASVLPHLMLEAGRLSELVELALTSAALPGTSLLERRDVELQRLQFAVKAALRSRQYREAAKLVLKAGGETAGDDRRRKMIQANTDLVAAFLEPTSIQEIVSRRLFGSGWIGAHHAYESALLSGRTEFHADARSRLRMAYQWLGNWSQLTKEEREQEEIADEDIVQLTLSHINLHGPTRGAESLRRWMPREVSFRVGRVVARRLIDHGRCRDLDEFAKGGGNNLCLLLAATLELRGIQRTLPRDVVSRALNLVVNTRVRLRSDGWDDREVVLDAVTALVEAAIRLDACASADAIAVLSRYLPGEPPRGLSSRYTRARWPLLRAYCLRAALRGQRLSLPDLAHSELRAAMEKDNQYPGTTDSREFREVIGAVLPWYQLWAEILAGRVSKEFVHDELDAARGASKRAESTYYGDELHTADEIALLWCSVLCTLSAATEEPFARFLQWKSELKKPLFTPTLTALARLFGSTDLTKQAALDLAVEAYDLIKSERSDADSKAEGYIDVARVLLAVSPPDAKAYFTEAVDVASRIGDENLSRWEAILDLAGRAARLDRPSPDTAYRLARCAELTYDYVDRDKHFDWPGTVEALCGLCPSSAIAILSRWRDRGFGWSERVLPIAVHRLIAGGSLDVRDALPLLGYRGQWKYDQLLDRALSVAASTDEKRAATTHVYQYARFGDGQFAKLQAVASRHGVLVDGLDEAVAREQRRQRAESHEGYNGAIRAATAPQSSALNWDAILGGRELTNPDALSGAYSAFRNTEPPFHDDQFFREAMRRVPLGSEAGFVHAVANCPDIDLYRIRSFLEEVPEAWKERLAITSALRATVKLLCRRYCMEVRRSRHYEVVPFRLAAGLAGIAEAELAEEVLDAIGASPDPADAQRLFSMVSILTLMLTEGEALEVLGFGLSLFTPVLEDRDGDGPWSVELQPPADVKASVAGYIWASMAAPEGCIRWEGAHAVLGVVALGRADILAHVFGLAKGGTGGVFVDATLPYYRLHALQWLLIGLARAASERPEILAPFATELVGWALNEQPHVMIRQFAARASLVLAEHGLLGGRGEVTDRLSRVNGSLLPVVESKLYNRDREIRPEDSGASEDERYYFGIDIGPYWYAPLGRVFGLSQGKIESEGLKTIQAEFGLTTRGRWDEDARHKRKLYHEGHTYASHGSYPRADDLDFYQAYHGMMITAGRLLATTPTHRDSEFAEADEFADWISRHDLARPDGRWLWDRRDPEPQERPSWSDQKSDDAAAPPVTAADCDEALRTGSMVNLWGGWTAVESDLEQSVYIRSALVWRDTAPALLRALQTAKDPHDYALPSAGSDMEIDEAGFQLRGWIADRERGGGLDDQDRWAGGISFPPPMPAQYLVDVMGLHTDADCRIWRNRPGDVVMVSQVWGHYDEGKRYEGSNPVRGDRLQASLSFVTDVLAQLGSDLIVEVTIDRRRRSRAYETSGDDERRRIKTRAGLYLLGPDGQFHTV